MICKHTLNGFCFTQNCSLTLQSIEINHIDLSTEIINYFFPSDKILNMCD